MKTFRQFTSVASSLAAVLSLFLAAGNTLALGPGVTGQTGGVNTGVTAGSANAGAQNAGVSSAGSRGGGTAQTSGARSFTAPATTAARPGVSFSNNGPRFSAGPTTGGMAGRANAPTAASQVLRSAPAVFPSNRGYQPSRPQNAWNGVAGSTSNGAMRTPQRLYGGNGATNNRSPGQHLYPGPFNSGSANANTNRFVHGSGNGTHGNHDGDRPHRHHGYFPYYANNGYPFPYIPYNSGYYGAYSYPYFGASTYYGLNMDSAVNYGNTNPGDPNVDFTEPVQPADSQEPQPPQQQAPTNVRQSAVPSNGPDSLVEAVQQELSKRGYFGGKVDAMYSADTKEALRRFQIDRHLAATGLINEATLHALQLD